MMMSNNLINMIVENDDDNFVIQDTSILVEGITYYFTHIDDKSIYRGKFKNTFNSESKTRFVFTDVDIYDKTEFKRYTNSLSTIHINKIYYI